MKFGICTDWKNEQNLLAAKAAGADYVELNFQSFADQSKETIAALGARLDAYGLPCLAYNGMLPGALRVTGEKKSFAAARDFVAAVLEKVQVLPARTVVFGSGAARMLDGNNTKENGMQELTEFLRDYAAPTFAAYGFTCVIEPLSECNFLRTMQDGMALAKAVDHPAIRLLADFYHVGALGEDLCDFASYRDYLRHAHIAAVAGRAFPRAGDGEDYAAILRALRAAGYNGYLSVEAVPSPDRELATEYRDALAVLRAAQ